jgi:hypothetical protein
MVDDSTSISWESVYKLSCKWVDVLTWCNFVMNLTKEHHQIMCNLGKGVTETLARKRELYTGVWMACLVQGRLKKARQMKSKVKTMLIIFFDIKGIVHKKILSGRPNSQFCIIPLCFMATAWNWADFTLKFVNKINCCCITTMHHLMLPSSP